MEKIYKVTDLFLDGFPLYRSPIVLEDNQYRYAGERTSPYQYLKEIELAEPYKGVHEVDLQAKSLEEALASPEFDDEHRARTMAMPLAKAWMDCYGIRLIISNQLLSLFDGIRGIKFISIANTEYSFLIPMIQIDIEEDGFDNLPPIFRVKGVDALYCSEEFASKIIPKLKSIGVKQRNFPFA